MTKGSAAQISPEPVKGTPFAKPAGTGGLQTGDTLYKRPVSETIDPWWFNLSEPVHPDHIPYTIVRFLPVVRFSF